ncbi:hypothetical protein L204_101054 [Cryptococcus depauperatus]
MKISHPKSIFNGRSTPISRPLVAIFKGQQLSKQQQDQKTEPKDEKRTAIEDGLAVCLLGFSVAQQKRTETLQENQISEKDISPSSFRIKLNMYDLAYEEELRQQTVMAEVLPDAEMWRKWEKTEAPLRQGRGWYPRLDRHFLELLVISEIHCLAHPLNSSAPLGFAERIHRHASRVRRVACERIGPERLHAYCERVKEAFEAYMMGGWARAGAPLRDGGMDVEHHEDIGFEIEREHEELEERGRSPERGNGSVKREFSPAERSPVEVLPEIGLVQMTTSNEDSSHLLEINLKDVSYLDQLSEETPEMDSEEENDTSSSKVTVGTSWSGSSATIMEVDKDAAYSKHSSQLLIRPSEFAQATHTD